jgi:hypothetical protein
MVSLINIKKKYLFIMARGKASQAQKCPHAAGIIWAVQAAKYGVGFASLSWGAPIPRETI